ncbi:DoxX family protein [Undibacterium seohonense]|jgi:putative oxidoreductase|uniref:DoxX family protein n=1 Tax=Undibacterium seohonense TaxID=1344950 RepID=A0ABR6X9Q4_9BURK|nr:DoxX family protein [Undibacterium seohonense]MBC3809567.1 DoxX family protein [Undibacterium seohonense]
MNKFLKMHQTAMRLDSFLPRLCSDIFSLGLRIFIAWQFLKSARTKLFDWQSTIELFRDEYQVPMLPPEVAAYVGTGGELIFGILLVIGLFSRWSALGLLLINIMAVVSYPVLWNLDCPAALNDHFYWGILLVSVVLFGEGRVSLDHFLQGRYKR